MLILTRNKWVTTRDDTTDNYSGTDLLVLGSYEHVPVDQCGGLLSSMGLYVNREI